MKRREKIKQLRQWGAQLWVESVFPAKDRQLLWNKIISKDNAELETLKTNQNYQR